MQAIIALASEYGRYGYRRITVKLGESGWKLGTDWVQRIWRREGLKTPQKQWPRREANEGQRAFTILRTMPISQEHSDVPTNNCRTRITSEWPTIRPECGKSSGTSM